MNAVRRVSSRGRLMMAVDLGGTKILAGLISVDGRLVRELRRPVDAWNRSALLTQLVSVVREIQDHVPARGRLEGVGVAVPGAVRPDGTVWAPNLKEWRRVALADHLTKYTGLRAVVENDRLTSLLGEQWCGAARGRFRSLHHDWDRSRRWVHAGSSQLYRNAWRGGIDRLVGPGEGSNLCQER